MTQPYGSAPYSPAPAYGAPVEDPGKTLGIVGFVLAFVFAVAGIVVSAIARKKSREAGFDNQLAKWGLILSIVFTAIGAIGWILYIVAFAALVATGEPTSY
jgi:preprotein translocase subunit SecG